MWDVLLLTSENCADATFHDLNTNGNIIRTEYRVRRRTKLAVYDIPDYILEDHLGAYLMQYGQLVSVTKEYETGEWFRFDVGPRSLHIYS